MSPWLVCSRTFGLPAGVAASVAAAFAGSAVFVAGFAAGFAAGGFAGVCWANASGAVNARTNERAKHLNMRFLQEFRNEWKCDSNDTQNGRGAVGVLTQLPLA